jgi:Holliday junction resolvase RusA-like endonuclease
MFNGHAVTPKRTREYEKTVGILAGVAGAYPCAGPVRLTCSFYMGDSRRRDLDNVLKAISDGLNGVAWIDDSQVVEIHATKSVDRQHPRAVVRVEELDG